jgi:hypothetical protein
MGELRKISDVSSDGLRKVEINEVDASSCIIRLYNDNFCVMDIITKENVFELNRTKLSNRKYLSFAEKHIEKGVGQMSISAIESSVNFGCRQNSRCEMVFHFNSGLMLCCGTHSYTNVSLDIGEGKIISPKGSFDRYSYDYLAGKTSHEIFDLSYAWNVVTREYGKYDGVGNQLCCFEEANIKYYGYQEVIDGLNKTKYLDKVGYLDSKLVINLENLPKKDRVLITKANIIGKRIVILYFKDDATPVFDAF